MNSLKRLICLIICTLSLNYINAQNLRFETASFDFGEIKEDGGTVSHTFALQNGGGEPVVIVTASSSCGCTVPSFSRQPIAAGKSSTITVTYDPMDRPGRFNKSVRVITAPENQQYTLTITGNVTPRQKSVEEQYPFDMGGGLRIAANYYPLSLIEQGERKEVAITYTNTSKRPINIRLTPETSSGALEVDAPATIKAGQKGVMVAAYDLSKGGERYGLLNDKLKVEINGKESKYKLMINAHAVDNFTSKSKSSPAIANLSARIIKLGELSKRGKSKPVHFTIENIGIDDLIIRDIELGEGLAADLKQGCRIKADESLTVEVWAEGAKLDYGNFSRYVTLTLNDPERPLQRVRITGIVEDKR